MVICKRATFAGRVQGVGFRYTAQRLAAGIKVVGYVRNLSNGNVELVAQGEADQVQAFLDAVARRMAQYIHHSSVVDENPCDYQGFGIRY
jgi:acylphosphatase